MKYMRRTVGYAWIDGKTNTKIAKELNIIPVLDKIKDNKRKWIQHVNRMPRKRLSRLIKTTR
jgi:FixJ family two-component response regulator